MSAAPPPLKLELDNTYGALLVGVMVAGFLHGVSCVQAWCYFTQQRDGWLLKSAVISVMVFDTLHQALISHSAYRYFVTHYGEPMFLGQIEWSLLLEVLFNGFTALIVQSFLAVRIYILSKKNIYLTGGVFILILAEFFAITTYYAIAHDYTTFAELVQVKKLSITVNALAATGDIIIAVILTIVLHKSRTGFRRSDTMINTMIVFAVNTGALTSLCALASLISITAAPNTFIYIAFFFCIGRLYSNSLLATLNARSMIRNALDESHNSCQCTTTQGGRKTGVSSTVPNAISIKIDTTKEFSMGNGDTKEHDERMESAVELKMMPV